jgi:hypothetical protein
MGRGDLLVLEGCGLADLGGHLVVDVCHDKRGVAGLADPIRVVGGSTRVRERNDRGVHLVETDLLQGRRHDDSASIAVSGFVRQRTIRLYIHPSLKTAFSKPTV